MLKHWKICLQLFLNSSLRHEEILHFLRTPALWRDILRWPAEFSVNLSINEQLFSDTSQWLLLVSGWIRASVKLNARHHLHYHRVDILLLTMWSSGFFPPGVHENKSLFSYEIMYNLIFDKCQVWPRIFQVMKNQFN